MANNMNAPINIWDTASKMAAVLNDDSNYEFTKVLMAGLKNVEFASLVFSEHGVIAMLLSGKYPKIKELFDKSLNKLQKENYINHEQGTARRFRKLLIA